MERLCIKQDDSFISCLWSLLFFLKNNNQIISDDEMKRMSESQLSSLWDGRIESLLTVDT